MAKAKQPAPNIFDDVKSGDHLACLYGTAEERLSVLDAFLRQGLAGRERILYIADNVAANTVRERLRADDVAPEPYLATGQLTVISPETVYLADGSFDPDAALAYFGTETEKALGAGYAGLRVVYEMDWVIGPEGSGGVPGVGRVIEYESRMNSFCASHACIGMCLYDRRRFQAGTLLDILLTHALVVVDGAIYRNFYYMPPDVFAAPDRPAVTLEHWIAHLREHKRMAHALEANEKKYRLIIENASDIIYSFSLDGIIEFVTPNVRQWGYDPAEIVGGPFIKYIYPDDVKHVLQDLKKTIDTEQPVLTEMRLVKKDGEVVPVEEVGSVTKDERGRVVGITGIIRDVSARKKADDALRASEEKYRVLFDGAADLIAVVDTRGNFLDLNKKFEEESGWSRKEMLGKNVFRCGIVTAGSVPKLAYNLAQLLAGREYGIFEVEGVMKQGGKVPYELRAIPIKEGDKIVAIQAILRNLTERRKTEEALRHRMDELEKFNKFAVGREMKMMELKERIKELERKLEEK